MYVYERKSNKAKVTIAIGFTILFLFVCALFIWRQNNEGILSVSKSQEENKARLQLPSFSYEEQFALPYTVNAATLTHFFDSSKDQAALANAVVEFEGVYRPSQGVDYGFDDKVFEVTAMLSGKVLEIKDDSLMGKSVVIQSDAVTITYQSLSAISVSEGQQISQSTVIGLSGENLYNQSLGIHLHVVAEKDGKLLDPASLIGRKLSEIE